MFKRRKERRKLITLIEEGSDIQNSLLNELKVVEHFTHKITEMSVIVDTQKTVLDDTTKLYDQLKLATKKMEEKIEFFSGIAELFANYIVYDMKTSRIHGYPPQKESIIYAAHQYLQKRNAFWRLT